MFSQKCMLLLLLLFATVHSRGHGGGRSGGGHGGGGHGGGRSGGGHGGGRGGNGHRGGYVGRASNYNGGVYKVVSKINI